MTNILISTIFLQHALAVRQWEDEHFPLEGSLLVFDLLMVAALHTLRRNVLSLKQLHVQLNYSEAGIRKQLKRCIDQGWLELIQAKEDRRVKYIVSTPKLLKMLQQYIQYSNQIDRPPPAMTFVDVFVDLACTKMIATMTVQEDFAPASEDFNDGQDWWNRVMAQVEIAHGSRWQCIVVRSADGQQGRRFVRQHVAVEAQPLFHPRVFGFSNSLHQNPESQLTRVRFYDLGTFDFGFYRLDGSDERIIQHLASVFGCVQQQFKYAWVFDQPIEWSDSEFRKKFQVLHAIELKDQSHYLALESLDASLNQIYQMKREAQVIGETLKHLSLSGMEVAEQLDDILSMHLSQQFANFEQDFVVR